MEPTTPSPLLDDRFLLFECVGRGGMARVYRAFDRAERRLVAVKVATEDCGSGADPFAAEFDLWSRLRHPNIVRAHEMSRAKRGPVPPGTPYLVLENFPGAPAHRALKPGCVGAEPLGRFTVQVLRALVHVHAAGLVHRDLKPGNILVSSTPTGGARRVKLTDFGLAAEAGQAGRPGQISGSLPYVSPEALLGAPLDGRADLYGLGIVLHLLASGRMPIDSRDPAELLRWHLTGPLPDPVEALPGLPARLARFVIRLLARDRDDRPSSAEEALALLGEESSRSPRPAAAVDRGDRATLRLALDAARRGARRVLCLPPTRRRARALTGQACSLAHAQGSRLVRITEGSAKASMTSGVLSILALRRPEARARFERLRLETVLPVGFLGETVLWDEGSSRVTHSSEDRAQLRRTARSLATFLLESEDPSRSLVVVFEPGALRDPLAGAFARALDDAVRSRVTEAHKTAGLLVIREAEEQLEPSSVKAGNGATRPASELPPFDASHVGDARS